MSHPIQVVRSCVVIESMLSLGRKLEKSWDCIGWMKVSGDVNGLKSFRGAVGGGRPRAVIMSPLSPMPRGVLQIHSMCQSHA
jgi:hypothetical protein